VLEIAAAAATAAAAAACCNFMYTFLLVGGVVLKSGK
jgi:hypothetical protein